MSQTAEVLEHAELHSPPPGPAQRLLEVSHRLQAEEPAPQQRSFLYESGFTAAVVELREDGGLTGVIIDEAQRHAVTLKLDKPSDAGITRVRIDSKRQPDGSPTSGYNLDFTV